MRSFGILVTLSIVVVCLFAAIVTAGHWDSDDDVDKYLRKPGINCTPVNCNRVCHRNSKNCKRWCGGKDIYRQRHRERKGWLYGPRCEDPTSQTDFWDYTD